MTQEQLRMQMLAGIITKDKYEILIKEINFKGLAAGAALGLSTFLPSTGISQDTQDPFYKEEKYSQEILNLTPKIISSKITDFTFTKDIPPKKDIYDLPTDYVFKRVAVYGDNTYEFFIFPKLKFNNKLNQFERVGYKIYINGNLIKGNKVRKEIEKEIFPDLYINGEFLPNKS
jgi:hypothetical protein